MLRLLLVCALLASMASAARAQINAAQLVGLVRDQSGAVVPAASVTATDLDRHTSRTTTSNEAGAYVVAGLGPGRYRVIVSAPGFQAQTRDEIRLETGASVRLDIELVAGLVDAVTVSAGAPMLREVSATLGEVIGDDTIVGLPLNGRSFISLAALAPGVAVPPGSPLPRINGGRPRTNEYLFDGISVLQPEPGQVAIMPVLDAVQEFKIERNSPPAEFGRFNGGVVNLTTKSGTNQWRGTAFGFLRHEMLNARHVFAPATGAAPRFRRGQFGGVLGGPVRRDRTFFFVDYQGQRQHVARTAISTVPTLLQRAGVFTEPVAGRVPGIYDPATTSLGASRVTRLAFENHTIPASRMDAVAVMLLHRYPLPTAGGTGNNYRRTGLEIDDQEQFDLRLDQRSARDQLFVRVSRAWQRFVPVTPLPDGSGVISGTLGPQDTGAWAVAASAQRVFSSTLVHELRIGDTRRHVSRSAATLPGPASTLIPGLPSAGQFAATIPTIQIAGYQQLGSPSSAATDFGTSVTQLADTLTWLRGRHTVKAGADLRWQRLDVVQPPSPTGLFQFSSEFTDLPGVTGTGHPLASFLLGQVLTFSLDLQSQAIRHRARNAEFFMQDDWRISDRWTISPGVRYTLNFPSYEKDNQAAVFDLDTRRLEFLGRDGNPRTARDLQRFNVGPRLGIAGKLADRAVLSTGFGLVWIEQAGITTPFTAPVFPFLQTVSERSLDDIEPAFVLSNGPSISPIAHTADAGRGQGVFAVDRDLGSGYVQQWNVALQQALTSTTAIEAAYVGSKITRVGVPDVNLNQLTVDQLALAETLLERVPNPYFGLISRASSLGDPTIPRAQLLKPYPDYTTVALYRNNVGTTNYHGLTLKLERRRAGGLSYMVSYTRSRLEDDASSVFDASILTGPVANYPVADTFNRQAERDVSTGDIPHVFVASALWTVPSLRVLGRFGEGVLRDWSLASIVTLQSGTPVAVTQATNFNAFAGFGVQRPNQVANPTLPRNARSAARWFDTNAFAMAERFTLGTTSRNPVRGPAFRNVDLALTRRVTSRSRLALDLRVEVFNLLDTPALGQPNGVLGSPAFGTITTAGDPRVTQVAIKLLF